MLYLLTLISLANFGLLLRLTFKAGTKESADLDKLDADIKRADKEL